ncbi:MAG: hypothetical protein LWW94_07920 [Candidatus Desulfofervidaceae bacterium]|nr:hypothetical protein [Candidatus Desulfofervidaceae bacterium]
MLVIGTVPLDLEEIITGPVTLKDGQLRIDTLSLEINLGTTTLLAAAAQTLQTLKGLQLQAILVGDKGEGKGSKKLYHYLTQHEITPQKVVCGHYIMPYVAEFKQTFPNLRKHSLFFMADAGMMYAAKAAGLATRMDLFTPDAGEMAFLADAKALHPAYVKRILFELDTEDVAHLIKEAHKLKNIPRFLVVKGKEDLIVSDGEIVERISSPSVEAMETMGGTGDSLVGILAALLEMDMPVLKAASLAARINREAGKLARPTPATRVSEIILAFPQAIKEVLQ